MKPFRGGRDELQQGEPHHGHEDEGQPGHPSKSHRHLQKLDLIFTNLKPDADSADDTPALQTSPLPFQQSQSACPDMDDVYGYTTLSALRDDLRVYFEIIHGKPPPPSSQQQTATTAGTAIPPPLFTTVSAAGGTPAGGTADDGTASTTAAATESTIIATGATATETFLESIISTTAASGTVTDIAVTTTVGTALSPAAKNGVRKRIRQHLHENDRRMQIAALLNQTMAAFDNAAETIENITSLDNVIGTLVEGTAGDSITSTLENVTLDNVMGTLVEGTTGDSVASSLENITLDNVMGTLVEGMTGDSVTSNLENVTLDNVVGTLVEGMTGESVASTLENVTLDNVVSAENATLTLDGDNFTETYEDNVTNNVTQTLDGDDPLPEIDDYVVDDDSITLEDFTVAQTLDGDNATQTVMDDNITSDNATEWDTNFTTTSLSNATSATLTDSTSASNPNLSVDFEIEQSIPVQFNICPGVFNFKSASGNADPIVIEALTWNPVWIKCVDSAGATDDAGGGEGTGSAGDKPASRKRNLAESSCVFSGGNIHMLFNNYGSSSSKNSTKEQEPTYHPLTITGISFQGASKASVSMYDPRGEIVFEDCQWESMSGAALVIDGRYVGTYVQGSTAVGTGSGGGGGNDGSRPPDPAENDILEQFYQDIATPAPFTANPSPAPNSEPTTDPPNTPFPTTLLRIPASPTISPQPTMEANVLNRPPEGGGGGYTGPPTLTSLEGDNITETSSTEGSFLLPTTIGLGTTAFVDSSTTWNGFIESTITTSSTEFGAMTETLSTKIVDEGADVEGADVNVNQTDDGVQTDGGVETDDVGQTDDGGQGDNAGIAVDGGVNNDDGGQADFGYLDDFSPRLLESDSLYFDDASIYNFETDEARFLRVENIPKSIIKLRSCSFRENTGPATIILTSQHEEMLTKDAAQYDDIFEFRAGDMRMVHSIHLTLEDSMFDSDTVKSSVILNDGGRLQTSGCMFRSNTADSIIQIESGTLAMSQTEFTGNTITGDAGLVEIDVGSTVESNDNNCDTTDSSSTVQNNGDIYTPASSRLLQDNLTDFRNAAIENERLSAALRRTSDLNATMTSTSLSSASDMNTTATSTSDVNATESEFNLMDNSTEGVLYPSLTAPESIACAGIFSNGICRKFPTVCEVEKDEFLDEGCLSNWDDLVTAVRERPNGERDFVICRHATMDIESSKAKAPVVIDSDYITIKCGPDGSLSDQCVIVGGVSQFYIVGSSSGVELAGLRMVSSSGSSIIAAGSKESTLRLKNCEWASNTGESVVLIKSESEMGAIEDALDSNKLMSTTDGGAMAVEIIDCIFRKNTLKFGTISNFGGTVTVYKTLFEWNTAKGGDIVVTNNGSCKVEESCFDTSSSSTPGTIFVEFGSSVSAKNNFGINNTSAVGTCDAIFRQTARKSCLDNPALCDGTCQEFTKTTCSLPMYDKFVYGIATSEPIPSSTTPTPTPVHKNSAPSQALASNPEGPRNIIPIIVASLVSAFIVFGMAGIIWRRKIQGKGGGGGVGSSTKRSNLFKRSSAAQHDDLHDSYDGLDEVY